MSTTAKKVILILSGFAILAITYFFIFQPNDEELMSVQMETTTLQSRVTYLNTLQLQVEQMRVNSGSKDSEMNAYFAEFPSLMTEQKGIYNVYQLMVKTGIQVQSIQPAENEKFFENGNMTLFSDGESSDEEAVEETSEGAEGTEGEAEGEETVEISAETSPESRLPIQNMVGKYTDYSLAVTGTYKQIMAACDWISENDEHMSLRNISLSYDSSVGMMSGQMVVRFYSMNGNGQKYVEPDISGIQIGADNIFGTIEMKNKKKKRDK